MILFTWFVFQILLESKTKLVTERGTSESTSGCESGQNYESDENEGCSRSTTSAKSASHSPESCSSENISKDNENAWHQRDIVDGAALNIPIGKNFFSSC